MSRIQKHREDRCSGDSSEACISPQRSLKLRTSSRFKQRAANISCQPLPAHESQLLIQSFGRVQRCREAVVLLASVAMALGNPILGRPESARRRSQRVILSLRVVVRTEGMPEESSFKEETHTLVVNAHGALLALAGKVNKGQKLRLTNVSTRDEELCQVVYLGSTADTKTQVGVEFLKPSPDFWHIAFPPEDWATAKPNLATANNPVASG